jgi:isoamylase
MSLLTSLQDGRPYPLGATWDKNGVNFAVYSEDASQILLCLFDEADDDDELILALPSKTGHVWHGYASGLRPGTYYGFRAEGLYRPEEGYRFNAAKLLVDPYAKELIGSVDWTCPVFGYQRTPHLDETLPELEDSAQGVPKSVISDPTFDWGDDRHPGTPLAESVIYEAHVKGMTALHPEVPEQLRGTYLGLASPAMIDYLKQLGITAIELQPVHSFIDDQFLVQGGLRNYWGYNSLGFFAPEQRYARPGESVRDFKEMVRQLHLANIEVILDVVYNHTAEGGRLGPTLSFRGLDNRSYYRLDPSDLGDHDDFTGTGNTLDASHPVVTRLIMDSLRYWVTEMHVDGFRFDLAPAISRGRSAFNHQSPFLASVAHDPVLSGAKLIAEPWDLGPEGYQLGHFPVGWSEWNDRFRDGARSFWLGHHVTVGEFARRVAGSADLYDRPGRGPLGSINLVTAHDGFTLYDLVSYNEKHNLANGEGNRDGHDHNLSRNFGVEGPTLNVAIEKTRRTRVRSLLATLLLSQGVPMMLAGDERLRTQEGNNNAYCQDNAISWLDWSESEEAERLTEYVRHLIALRKRRPLLRAAKYAFDRVPTAHLSHNTRWFDADASPMSPHNWNRLSPRTLQLVVAQEAMTGVVDGENEPLLLMFNGEDVEAEFTAPPVPKHRRWAWRVILDSSGRFSLDEERIAPSRRVAIGAGAVVVGAAVPMRR